MSTINMHNQWNAASNSETELKIVVSDTLMELGVMANIKGYFYLREAIIYMIKSDELIISMTKVLYPTVAQMFGTSAAKVESAIRHAIEVAWGRNDFASRRKVFSNMASNSEWKPSNSEFIATIVDRLKILD